MTGTHLIPLSFENQSVRVYDQDGNPWFAAADVCAALGIKNSRDAVARLDQDEKGVASTDTLGGKQDMIVLSEAGVYTIALRCRDAMTPGTLPFRFRKWVTGVALPGLRRGHDVQATGLTREDRAAIGGIVKGCIGKALADMLPALVNAEVLNTQAAVARGMTAGEVVEAAGVTNRKGLRGLPRRVSDVLRRFCSERGVAVALGRLGSTTAYVFDAAIVREWLTAGGKQFIHRMAEEKRGQGALKLVKE